MSKLKVFGFYILFLAVISLVVAGCGGGGGDECTDTCPGDSSMVCPDCDCSKCPSCPTGYVAELCPDLVTTFCYKKGDTTDEQTKKSAVCPKCSNSTASTIIYYTDKYGCNCNPPASSSCKSCNEYSCAQLGGKCKDDKCICDTTYCKELGGKCENEQCVCDTVNCKAIGGKCSGNACVCDTVNCKAIGGKCENGRCVCDDDDCESIGGTCTPINEYFGISTNTLGVDVEICKCTDAECKAIGGKCQNNKCVCDDAQCAKEGGKCNTTTNTCTCDPTTCSNLGGACVDGKCTYCSDDKKALCKSLDLDCDPAKIPTSTTSTGFCVCKLKSAGGNCDGICNKSGAAYCCNSNRCKSPMTCNSDGVCVGNCDSTCKKCEAGVCYCKNGSSYVTSASGKCCADGTSPEFHSKPSTYPEGTCPESATCSSETKGNCVGGHCCPGSSNGALTMCCKDGTKPACDRKNYRCADCSKGEVDDYGICHCNGTTSELGWCCDDGSAPDLQGKCASDCAGGCENGSCVSGKCYCDGVLSQSGKCCPNGGVIPVGYTVATFCCDGDQKAPYTVGWTSGSPKDYGCCSTKIGSKTYYLRAADGPAATSCGSEESCRAYGCNQ